MARTPKPWFWAERNSFYVTIRGDRHNLGPDKAEAEREFHRLMSLPEETPKLSGPSVAEILDKHLGWAEKHRERRTFEWYRDHAQSFVAHSPDVAKLPVAELKPFHVEEWVDAHPDWSPAYRRGAIVAIQRPFNWAVKNGRIPNTPIPHIEKPKPQRREQIVTPADWKRIRDHYPPGDPFLLLLDFCWETGVRPQEAKLVESRHVYLSSQRVIFPPEEAKGKKRTRVILLTPRAAEILTALMQIRRAGPLFVNADGNPWTRHAMACRFGRLKKHVGAKLAGYSFRHGFAQRMLEAGNDHLTVAELLGHKDGRTLATTYSHMNQADGHLRDALNRGNPDGKTKKPRGEAGVS